MSQIETILRNAMARQADWVAVTGKANPDIAATIAQATRLMEKGVAL